MTVTLLHNGEPCTESAVSSRALQYGDGVFRTVLYQHGELIDWSLHLRKLAEDCQALGIDPPDTAATTADALKLTAGRDIAVVKLIVGRQSAGRGYRPASPQGERWVMALDAPSSDLSAYRNGIVALLSTVQISEQPLLAGVKHLNRLDQVLASRNWPEDVQEALMCDAAGHLISGTRSNLFIVRAGTLLTPKLDRCGIAGIMRLKVLECSRRMNLKHHQIDLLPQDLAQAEEVFLTNSLIGIWPLRQLGAQVWTAPGRVTRQLMAAIDHPHASRLGS